MPSYQKQKSGAWKAIVRRSGYPTKTKTFPTKPEAKRWALEYEAHIDLADSTPNEDCSFASLMTLYLEDCETRLKRPDCEQGYWRTTKALLASYTLFTLTPTTIEKYTQKRLKIVSPATVRKNILFISRLYTFAQRKLHIDVKNPVRLVSLPKPSRPRDRIASDEEQRLILDNISERMRPVFLFAIETSMRRGELAALRWEWISVDRRKITLPESITKNGSSREVPLSTTAITTLLNLGIKAKGSVFGVTYEGITTAMYRVCIKTGIDNLRFHDLRHTAITKYARMGLTTAQLQVISGHKTLSQLNRYVNLKAEDVVTLME